MWQRNRHVHVFWWSACARVCSPDLVLAAEGEVDEGLEVVALAWDVCEQAGRPFVRLARQFPCDVQAVLADVGRFAHTLVSTDRFAERLLVTGDVEDVVDDLEEQAKLVRKCPVAVVEFVSWYRKRQRTMHRRRDQATRFQGVDLAKRAGRRSTVVAQVEVLAADHARNAGRPGELTHDAKTLFVTPGLGFTDEPNRLRVEGVARKDRGVLAKRDVASRSPSTEVVIVHRGKIVVDERVRVDELQCGGRWQDVLRGATEGLQGGHRKHRPHPFTASKE